MNKLITLSLTMVISINSNLLADTQKPSSILRKSKEAALIKAVAGSVIAILGLKHGVIGGPPATIIAHYQGEDIGPISKRVGYYATFSGLAIMYKGYKIVKDAFQDLEEIAQYPELPSTNQTEQVAAPDNANGYNEKPLQP